MAMTHALGQGIEPNLKDGAAILSAPRQDGT
jgi:hypothetical protein